MNASIERPVISTIAFATPSIPWRTTKRYRILVLGIFFRFSRVFVATGTNKTANVFCGRLHAAAFLCGHSGASSLSEIYAVPCDYFYDVYLVRFFQGLALWGIGSYPLHSTVVFVVQVRQRHRLGTVVTPYHIREAANHLGLGMEDVRECVQELGGTVWDDDDDQVNKVLK